MKYRYCLIGVLFILFCPSLLWGNEFHLIPAVSIQEEYNDNILLSRDTARSDFITTLSGSIKMVKRTDRFDADLLLRLDQLEYAKNSEFSATNQLYNGNFHYLVTPLLNIAAEGGYMRNENPTLNIEATGEVASAQPWDRITSSMFASYRFSEKTSGQVSYSHEKSSYEDSQSLDNSSHGVNALFMHDFSRYVSALSGRIKAGYWNYDSDDSGIDSVMSSVGLSRDLNKIWSINIDSGIRYTRSEISSGPLKKTNTGWGWLGEVSLRYSGERSNNTLAYKRELKPAYYLGGAAESDAVSFSAEYRILYELMFRFTAGYEILKSDLSEFSAQVINQRTFRMNPLVRYEFSRDMAGEASYSYVSIDDPDANTKAQRHRFSISFNIQHSFFE